VKSDQLFRGGGAVSLLRTQIAGLLSCLKRAAKSSYATGSEANSMPSALHCDVVRACAVPHE